LREVMRLINKQIKKHPATNRVQGMPGGGIPGLRR
jgi:hypothetical protein